MRRLSCVLLAVWWAIAAAPAGAETPLGGLNDPSPDPQLNEQVVKAPLTFRMPGGAMFSGQFVLTTFRPNGIGPFPAVIVNHGRDIPQRRALQGRNRMLAHFWLRRGFAVLAPTRIGYGVSGTAPDLEAANGPCDAKNYAGMAAAITAHIKASIDYAATLPWIDTENLVLVGASVGGFGVIAAAGRRLPGVKAVVNFAGGTGGWVERRPQQPCSPKSVELQIVAAAKQGAVPSLWLYSENDRYWGPRVPRDWHAAYIKAGGIAEFHMLPPLGDDGHNILNLGFERWRPLVDRFLVAAGYAPRKLPPDAPAPTGFAALEDTPAVSRISQRCRELYADFLKKDVSRAFAIGANGGCAYYAGQLDAMAKSLARCREVTKNECNLYAVNDAVVWSEPATDIGLAR